MLSLDILPNLIVPLAQGRSPHRSKKKKSAEALYESGVDYYKRNKYQEALTAFSESYDISRNPDTQYNIGMCFKQVGMCKEAIEAFRFYLRERLKAADNETDRLDVADAQERIRECKAEIVKIEGEVKPRDEYIPPPAKPNLLTAVSKTTTHPSSRNRKWGWTSLALSLASFAASGASLYMARKKQLEHGNLVDTLKTQGEVIKGGGNLHFANENAKQNHASSLNDLDQTMKRYNAAGIVTLSAGAAFLVGGLTLLRSDRRGRVASKVSLEPTLGSDLGLGLSIRF